MCILYIYIYMYFIYINILYIYIYIYIYIHTYVYKHELRILLFLYNNGSTNTPQMFLYTYIFSLVFHCFPFACNVVCIYFVTPCKCDDTLQFPSFLEMSSFSLNKILYNFPQIKPPTPPSSLKTTARWY